MTSVYNRLLALLGLSLVAIPCIGEASPQSSAPLSSPLSAKQLEQELRAATPSPAMLAARSAFFELAGVESAQDLTEQHITELKQLLLEWDKRMAPLLEESMQHVSGDHQLEESDKKADESQIESSGGLYFDTALSQLSYLGEVKLRDSRLHLDCRGLFVQLERESTADSLEKEKQQRTTTPSSRTTTSAGDSKAEAAQEATPSQLQESQAVAVKSEHAFLDLDHECLFLRGGKEGIRIQHQRGEIHATGTGTLAILSEKLGVFYILAENIDASYENADKSISQIHAKDGILFLLADDSIYLQRDVHIKHEQQRFQSAGAMRLFLQPSEQQEAVSPPFASFQKQYSGLYYLVAEQEVELELLPDAEQPDALTQIHTDQLSYDPLTGAIILSGEHSQISQGKQQLIAEGDSLIYWAADGSISAQARQISGQYERAVTETDSEGKQHTKLVLGEFQSHKQLVFLATQRAFYLPHGLRTEDSFSSLNSEKELLIPFLAAQPQSEAANPPLDADPQFRLPPLVLAQLGDPEGIYTSHPLMVEQRAVPSFALQGSSVQVSFAAGLAHIKSHAELAAIFEYDGRRLRAVSPDTDSVILLDEQGDLSISARDISMQIPQQNGTYTLHCMDSLTLDHDQALVLLQENTLITGPDMKLQSSGNTIVHLRPSGETEQKKRANQHADMLSKHPHLNYAFSGVDHVEMPRGASLQTDQLSLQNTGRLVLHLADEKKRAAHPTMQGIAKLQAFDHVRLLTRGSDQRLIYARGDRLDVDGYTAQKELSGHEVYLSDESSSHQVRGNARLILDAKNNINIMGDEQITRASELRDQLTPSTSKKTR